MLLVYEVGLRLLLLVGATAGGLWQGVGADSTMELLLVLLLLLSLDEGRDLSDHISRGTRVGGC